MLEILTVLPFVLLAHAEQIPDYEKPFAPIFTDKPIYTWTDKIKITILAPSWNTNSNLIDSIGGTEDHPIKISAGKNSLEPYKFTETDANSGIFAGEVILSGFSHDVDGDGDLDVMPRTGGGGPNNGFLAVERDESVTISFEFADGVILTESVPVSWNMGSIGFTRDGFVSGDSVPVRVVDADMNLNPEARDHIQVHFYSDSDTAGIISDAIETTQSSGVFMTSVVTSDDSASSGRLYLESGDQIFARYDDHTLPKPHSTSDSVEIITSANTGLQIPSTDWIENSPIMLTDNLGNNLESFSANNQMQIVGTITNTQDHRQGFVYLVQVIAPDGTAESIAWIKGELNAQQAVDVSQSWMPEKSGRYEIQTYVWSSIVDSIALGPGMSTILNVN